MALHPQAVAAIRLWSQGPNVTDPGFGRKGIEQQRRLALQAAGVEPKEPVEHVEDVDADGVPMRLYRPRVSTGSTTSEGSTTEAGAIVFLHGGGFVFGDIDTHDAQSRRIANRTGMAVLAVDYRRPPEHRFPAAPDDVDVALSWLMVNGPDVGLDITRLVALGDSAGGNLALVAALRNPNAFAAVVLVYPFIDPRMRFGSNSMDCGAEHGAGTASLTCAEARWYWQQYASRPEDLENPDLSPIDSGMFGRLPPTLVVAAEHDILLDEDQELARRIREAGIPVELSTYPGMIHGFWRHPAMFDAAEESLIEIADFLRHHLAAG